MNEESKIYYVYYLISPDTLEIFYVGKGKKYRMFKHESDVKNGRIPNNNYKLYKKIKYILDSGNNILYKKVKENLTNDEAIELEKNEISKIKLENLTNICPGGEGNDNFTYNDNKEIIRNKFRLASSRSYAEKYGDRSAEIIQKRLKSMNGYSHSNETKDKIRNSNTGKIFDDTRKRNIGLSKIGNSNMLGKHHSEQTKKLISKSNIGKKLSDIHKNKISESNLGKQRSKDHINKMRIGLINNHPMHNPEIKKKILQSLKGRKSWNKCNYIKIKCPNNSILEFKSKEDMIIYFNKLSDSMFLVNSKRISGISIFNMGKSNGYILLQKQHKNNI
jgi:hypothetical protein